MSMTSYTLSNTDINQRIPNFTLPSTHGDITIDNLLGTPLIIVFYPKDGSSVCTNQLAIYNEALPVFKRYNADLVAISVDTMKSHERFSKQLNLKFPLLSDSDPRGRISKAYDAYDEETKLSKRAIFVVNGDGNVFWSQIYPIGVNPGADGILKALNEMQSNSN